MSWSYRVCHRPSIPGGGFQLHEVYYDKDMHITMYSKNPITAFGEIPDELYEDMCKMMDAFDKEPLNLDHVDYLLRIRKEHYK
jgi:hypothetical protein